MDMDLTAYDVLIGIMFFVTLVLLISTRVDFNKLTLRAAYDSESKKWKVQKLLFGDFFVPYNKPPHAGKPTFNTKEQAESWIYERLAEMLVEQRARYGANVSFSHNIVRRIAKRHEGASQKGGDKS